MELCNKIVGEMVFSPGNEEYAAAVATWAAGMSPEEIWDKIASPVWFVDIAESCGLSTIIRKWLAAKLGEREYWLSPIMEKYMRGEGIGDEDNKIIADLIGDEEYYDNPTYYVGKAAHLLVTGQGAEAVVNHIWGDACEKQVAGALPDVEEAGIMLCEELRTVLPREQFVAGMQDWAARSAWR